MAYQKSLFAHLYLIYHKVLASFMYPRFMQAAKILSCTEKQNRTAIRRVWDACTNLCTISVKTTCGESSIERSASGFSDQRDLPTTPPLRIIVFLLRRLESNQLCFAYETNMIYISVSFPRNIIKNQFPFVLTILFNSRDMEVAALRGLLTNHTLQPFTWVWLESNQRSLACKASILNHWTTNPIFNK